MFVASNRIPVNPEHAKAFEQTFRERATEVDHMPGFVAFRLLRPSNPDNPYIVMTFWETEEHFRAWTESDEFKRGHARSGTLPPETFLGRPTLETHELIEENVVQ